MQGRAKAGLGVSPLELQPDDGVWDAFLSLADNRLTDTQKTVLALALDFEGETATRLCTTIAMLTGQDASTVRKTLAFFRRMGWMSYGSKETPFLETRFSDVGRQLAVEFKLRGWTARLY